MAFVNELITDQTPEKALIKALEKKYNIAISGAGFDRGREIFFTKWRERNQLALYEYGGPRTSEWLLVIKGTIVEIEKEKLSSVKISDTHYASTQKLTKLKINGELSITKAELLNLILEVMTDYKEIGIFSEMKQYDLTLDTREVQ